jgi:carbamoyltransferase
VDRQYPARFMLLVVDVKPAKYDVIPAVTHVDGTGRLQTVLRDGNPRYYDLIERFGQATGVPVILNTSFNLRGEPIVNTPAEAYSTFMRSGMDALVLGNHFIRKDGTNA